MSAQPPQAAGDSPQAAGDSPQAAGDSPQAAGDSPQAAGGGWLLLLFAAALGARLCGIERSLWYDELVTLYAFSGSLGDALSEQVAANNHPPASALAWLARGLLGEGELALRLPFAVLGAAGAAALAWGAARTLPGGAGAGLLAGALAALLPGHVLLSQQVRGYAGLLLAAALVPPLLGRTLAAPGRRPALLLVLSLALGVWSHATLLLPGLAWLALAGAAPALGLADGAGRRRALAAVGGGLAGGLLLLAPVLGRVLKLGRRWLSEPGAAPPPLGLPGLVELGLAPGRVGVLAAAVLVVLAAAGAAALARRGPAAQRALAVWGAALLPAALLVLSRVGAYPRFLAWALPALLALAALGLLVTLRAPAARLALLAALFAALAWQTRLQGEAELQDYRGAARVARQLAGSEGVVLSDASLAGAAAAWYDPALAYDLTPAEVEAALRAAPVPVVCLVPFPADLSPARRARLEAASGAPLVLPGRVTPILVYPARR